jgi:CDGSH-type Zn-finger protein/uncharacterized Fe-S cluster protein YjdI
MSDQYTGKSMDRRYTGQAVDITYNVKRCIHAEECVHRLGEVFDSKRRPWISPDATTSDRVAQVVTLCPSGALHYESKDDTPPEMIPESNTITLWHNGPLQLKGELRIEGTTVDVQEETRATLCRCGGSQNKPFCDNSHKQIDFDGTAAEGLSATAVPDGGSLKVTVMPNGPLNVEGSFSVYDEQGSLLYSGRKAALCRCGGSGKKPFCDGTHLRNGFTGE